MSAIIVSVALAYAANLKYRTQEPVQVSPQEIVPQEGISLPVQWGGIGQKLAASGVVDEEKFLALYANNPNLQSSAKNLLEQSDTGTLKINAENSGMILNLLWALGLGEKNDILEKGPMAAYGNVGNLASTGGWTLANGNAMDHYSKHLFFMLTKEQQELVERVAKNIYRPCCNNSTYFPDCNHGMAMLGLLELMASQRVSESAMYKAALQANSYWFPDTYNTIAQYLKTKGIGWNKADAKEVLGANFSSASGYQRIRSQVAPSGQKSGGSCGA